jgi:hypothetical protein
VRVVLIFRGEYAQEPIEIFQQLGLVLVDHNCSSGVHGGDDGEAALDSRLLEVFENEIGDIDELSRVSRVD